MGFEEFHLAPPLKRRLEQIGYLEPTGIQSQSMRPILDGRDVIGLAPTGTGKTAAFVVPLVQRCLQFAQKRSSGRRGEGKSGQRDFSAAAKPAVLVLDPTRELAIQVAQEAENISRGSVLRVACVYGGVSAGPQVSALREASPEILVGTPGRLIDLLESGELSLSKMRHLVIDEADRLLDMGFRPQIDTIVSRLPRERQTLLFSATMPDAVVHLGEALLNHPVRIEVAGHSQPVEHVRQRLFPVADHLKSRLLIHLLEHSSGTGVLIFARTRRRVGWVAKALERHGVSVDVIHGDRSQAQRIRALNKLRSGESRALVATDVAARGLHIEAVTVVVNYDLPWQAEEYVHRVGRAGHGVPLQGVNQSFEAWTLMDSEDSQRWNAIAQLPDVRDVRRERVPEFDYAEAPRGNANRRERCSSADEQRSAEPRRKKRFSKKRVRDDRGASPLVKKGKLRRRRGAARPLSPDQKPGGGTRRTGS